MCSKIFNTSIAFLFKCLCAMTSTQKHQYIYNEWVFFITYYCDCNISGVRTDVFSDECVVLTDL